MAEELNPVNVNVRARPLNVREKSESAQQCVTFYAKTNQIKIGDKIFTFDNVFPPESSQEEVYDDCVAPLLIKFYNGYNCTVLAYGQTGAGKTHSMGTEETTESMKSDSRGIIPRLVHALFQLIAAAPVPACFKVEVSMLEIYQEDIVDLLSATRDPLQIREHKGTVFVQGLSTTSVDCLESTMAQLEKGCQLRSKGSTAMNSASSRSHAIFTLILEKTAANDDDCGFTSKFHLVDLAGSERLKKTQAEGQRKLEGIKINEGLLALGNVISALAEGGRHIPYRDSKITRILQDSLGGNSCTVMIACISPADTNAEETLSTLRYADRTKKIKNKATVNVDPTQALILQLKEEVLRLRHENSLLRTGQGIEESTCLAITQGKPPVEGNEEAKRVSENFEKKIHELENKLATTFHQSTHLYTQLMKSEEEREKLHHQIFDVRELINSDEKEAVEKLETLQQMVIEIKTSDEDEAMDATTENEGEEMDLEFANKYMARQETLTRDMERIMATINEKEKLVEKTAASDAAYDHIKVQHEKDLRDLQTKIDQIQDERDKLAEQLKKFSNTGKVSEERRKRLQELEKELNANKKKMQELRRLESMKKSGEEKMKQMRIEIEQLKQERVRMMKKMKVENDKFRKWQMKNDKELQQIKSKERKREMEATRTKNSFTQQLTIYRRRVEEATASNKRLQQQLLKAGAHKSEVLNDAKLTDQLKHFIEDELNLVGTTYEASSNCDQLIEQRKQLTKKLSTTKAKRTRLEGEPASKPLYAPIVTSPLATLPESEPPSTPSQLDTSRVYTWMSPMFTPPGFQRRHTGDRSHVDDEAKKAELDKEIEDLNKEIGMCSSQIQELQKDCGAIDLEARIDSRWANIHTVAHAKVALKQLFEQASNDRRFGIDKDRKITDIKSDFEETKRSMQTDFDTLQQETEERLNMLAGGTSQVNQTSAEFEDKLTFLLEKIMSKDSVSTENVKALEELYEKLKSVQQVREEMENENKQHKKRRSTRLQSSVRPLARSASMAQMQDMPELHGVRTTRNKQIDRFGDVKNTLSVIDQSSVYEEREDDGSIMIPTKKGKKKKFTPPSPIKADVRESGSASRRDTIVLERAPLPEDRENSVEGMGQENVNTTFTVSDARKLHEDIPSMLGSAPKFNSRTELGKLPL